MFQNGSILAGVVTGGLSQLEHTRSLNNGQINKGEYVVHTTGNVTSALGVMAGIEYGAMLGSALLPGVGTVAGSIVGGLMGNKLGRYVGHQAGHLVKNAVTAQTPVQNQIMD